MNSKIHLRLAKSFRKFQQVKFMNFITLNAGINFIVHSFKCACVLCVCHQFGFNFFLHLFLSKFMQFMRAETLIVNQNSQDANNVRQKQSNRLTCVTFTAIKRTLFILCWRTSVILFTLINYTLRLCFISVIVVQIFIVDNKRKIRCYCRIIGKFRS